MESRITIGIFCRYIRSQSKHIVIVYVISCIACVHRDIMLWYGCNVYVNVGFGGIL